jgi:hypothetical protein
VQARVPPVKGRLPDEEDVMSASTVSPRRRVAAAGWLIRPLLCTLAALTLVTWVGVWVDASSVAQDEGPRFTEWSAPVNLGPVVNSGANEAGVSISRDGLSLYFGSTRSGSFDIWVSHRAAVGSPWGAPQLLGTAVNTTCHEQTPTLSIDGHWLYFARDCGGFGRQDIFLSRRRDKRDDLGWEPPVNLGPGVNTAFNESGPSVFEDEETGTITLYFSSDQRSPGSEDIFASTFQEDATFGPAVLVDELSSSDRDARPSITKDGLTMYFDSNRPGSLVGSSPVAVDLWVSTRASISAPWSTPESLGPVFNSPTVDARPVLSFDGTELYFRSTRGDVPVPNDLYVSTRIRIRGRDKDVR